MELPSSPESEHSGHYRSASAKRRDRGRDKYRDRRYSRSRSISYERSRRRSPERDLYKDLIDQDYGDSWERDRDRDRRRGDRDHRSRDRRDKDRPSKRAYSPSDDVMDVDSYDRLFSFLDSDSNEMFYNQKPNNKIIIRGLMSHITEADINSDLIQCGLHGLHIRLIRKKKTGASRGFAFVEFRTVDEATRWISYKQGVLIFPDHRATMQYTYMKDFPHANENHNKKDKIATDWYCGKCGVFNFKRRENCFKCYASREESEKGGEGSDEVSNILTKKIMLRNLDVLTNEESVLTVMQDVVPSLVSKISKVLICRDPLTSTSRGICYLHFDNLVDSMNTHNALKALEMPLQIDNREVSISYCVDSENRTITKQQNQNNSSKNNSSYNNGDNNQSNYGNNYQYTLSDVPRLAEYSASVYASNPAEHDHYMKFYTNYYMTQINQGAMSNLPNMNALGENANSGAAVAQSALQRKLQKSSNKIDTSPVIMPINVPTPQVLEVPNGTDSKKYPTPDVSLYQYDDTSGYYYCPLTGLYYDAHSQYYYNNEKNIYLYWDAEKSTYIDATAIHASSSAASMQSVNQSNQANDAEGKTDQNTESSENSRGEGKSKHRDQPHDKVKVAKKIVKDMEKWAKQLNQKKDYMNIPPPIPKQEEQPPPSYAPQPKAVDVGYADVGFSLLEKKDRTQAMSNYLMSQVKPPTKLIPHYASDSDNEAEESGSNSNEKDHVDFDNLTCLLCKRAFQSLEILNKHVKMSTLHKENLQKMGSMKNANDMANKGANYRDRAKERRLKYGEDDTVPVNRTKERFQKELRKQATAYQPTLASMPISSSNVGNKLLQKMGWTEGQGLGRSNQGRTNIIEAETRVSNAGLGSKCSSYGSSGDDYKTYIKKMMKSRYEQVDVQDN